MRHQRDTNDDSRVDTHDDSQIDTTAHAYVYVYMCGC